MVKRRCRPQRWPCQLRESCTEGQHQLAGETAVDFSPALLAETCRHAGCACCLNSAHACCSSSCCNSCFNKIDANGFPSGQHSIGAVCRVLPRPLLFCCQSTYPTTMACCEQHLPVSAGVPRASVHTLVTSRACSPLTRRPSLCPIAN